MEYMDNLNRYKSKAENNSLLHQSNLVNEFSKFLVDNDFTGEDILSEYEYIKNSPTIPIAQRSVHLWVWVQERIETLNEAAEEALNESQLCDACNGSGEGCADGTRCAVCGGTGAEQ